MVPYPSCGALPFLLFQDQARAQVELQTAKADMQVWRKCGHRPALSVMEWLVLQLSCVELLGWALQQEWHLKVA